MNANFFPVREKSSQALRARILGFVIIALSPIAVWLIRGSVDPYGQQQHKTFPPVIDLIKGRAGAFDDLGQAALERSAATRTAILLQSLVRYQFGIVDTDEIISGKNGWLFYKPEFWNGKCLEREKVKRTLAHVDVLTSMARAAGLDMVVSVSPDKSSIYPDMLAPYYRQYWRCKARSAALWRDIAKTEAPELLDHAVVLREARAKDDLHPLYFHTDTHWVPYGSARAIRQLMQRILPEKVDAARKVEIIGMSEKETDMKNHMLLLRGTEPFETVSDGLDGVHDDTDTVILHDSFYNATRERLSKLFPNGKLINFQNLKERSDEVTKGTRLIVNSVERAFLRRFEGKWLGRKGEVSSAILARNGEAAGACTFQSLPAPAAGGSQPIIVSVPPSASGFSPCLRLKLEGWRKGDLNVLLPVRHGPSRVFESGRSVTYEPDEAGLVNLVLPDYVQGRDIGIELPAGASLSQLELGERPSFN